MSGSAELFPQHCQIPNLSNIAHLKALTKELTTTTSIAAKMHKGCTFIHKLKIAIDNLLTADGGSEQRVGANSMTVPPEVAPVGQPIKQITKAPPIMKSRDPTAKRNLIKATRTHQRKTRRYTPGVPPAITRDIPVVISPETQDTRQKSPRVSTQIRVKN